MSEAAQDAKFLELTGSVLGDARARASLAVLRTMDVRMKAADVMARDKKEGNA